MHQHSIEAYRSIPLAEREAQVLAAFQNGELLTDKEAAEAVGLPIASVQPRITMLVQRGVLSERGRRQQPGSSRRVRVTGLIA